MKYIEKYLKDIIKVKPLGTLTTKEDELDGISGEMVYIGGKCSNIFISRIDYANWLEKQGKVPVTINIDKMVEDYANNEDCDNEGFGKPVNCMIRAYRQGLTDAIATVMLEKQGEQKPFDYEDVNIQQKDFAPKSALEAIKEEKVDDVNKVEPKDYNSIDPHFGKSADKVEPKFKVKKGKWYVCTDTFVSRGKIIAIKGQTYQSKQEDDTITCEDNCLFIDRHDGKASDYFRPWTIQDAKEGDVLFHSDSASNGIFIFKEIIDKGFAKEVICYCDYDSEDHFCLGEHHTCCWADAKILHPATKEQRDTLMKAMADAGYTFNFEKKELKKIEQVRAKWSEEDELSCFESALFTAFSDAWQSYLLGEDVNVKQWAKEQSKELLEAAKEELKGHNSAWSEEDMSKVQRICKYLNEAKKYYADITEVRECMDWLKSLEDRVGCEANCTTTKEWNESDKEEFQIAIDTLVEAGQHDSAHWLKSLKQRIGG